MQSSGFINTIPWHTSLHDQKSPVTSPVPLPRDSSHRRTFPNAQPTPRDLREKKLKRRRKQAKRCLRLLRAWHLGLVTGLGLRSCTLSFQGYAPHFLQFYMSKILPAVSIHKPRIGNASFPHASVDKYLGGTQIFQVHIRTLLPWRKSCLFSLLFNFTWLHRGSGWLKVLRSDLQIPCACHCWNLGALRQQNNHVQVIHLHFPHGNRAIRLFQEKWVMRYVKIFGPLPLMKYRLPLRLDNTSLSYS